MGLRTLVSDRVIGQSGLGSSLEDIWFGILGLGSLAWGIRFRIVGLKSSAWDLCFRSSGVGLLLWCRWLGGCRCGIIDLGPCVGCKKSPRRGNQDVGSKGTVGDGLGNPGEREQQWRLCALSNNLIR